MLRKYMTRAQNAVKKGQWKSVVGLEVHAQINSESKLFSGSSTRFGLPLNAEVSLFDAAIPGTLPTLNRKCVESGIRTALAFNCRVNEVSMFDRKHYFYADMPAGYQITQQRAALANDGAIVFPIIVPGQKIYYKSVRLLQLQLEQDSGKSLHDDVLKRSLIDLNRAGLPLMELVFAPELENGEEAASLVKELIIILKRLQTCSCKMEVGALRVDANISVHEVGKAFGVRTEVKNIGSIRSISQAISYEIQRQLKIVTNGGHVKNETRSWNANERCTQAMRDKEVLQDYRFMPEPNLTPLHLKLNQTDIKVGRDDENQYISVSLIAKTLPELPEHTRKKLIDVYNLNQEAAIILVNEPFLLSYFLNIAQDLTNTPTKVIANFLVNDLQTFCHKHNVDLENCNITYHHLRDILKNLHEENINLRAAKLLIELVHQTCDLSVNSLIEKYGMLQITNADVIERLCREAIKNQPKAVTQYQSGKSKALFAVIGEVAKLSGQKANMKLAVACLKEILKK